MKEKNTKMIIDLEYLRGVIDGDKEFENELKEVFFDNAQKNINSLQDAIDKKDNNLWYMSAHAFKGASGSIGAFDLAKVLEIAQRSFEDSSENKIQILSKVKSEFALVKDLFEKGI